MKQIILLLLCFLAYIGMLESCKKDDSKPNSYTPPSITGTWELRQAQTKNIPIINYPAGNGSVLKFTNADYSTYVNGALTRSGQYTLTSDTTAGADVCLVLPGNEYRNRIIFDADYASTKTFLQVDSDTIKFVSGCFAVDSGYYYVYIKQ